MYWTAINKGPQLVKVQRIKDYAQPYTGSYYPIPPPKARESARNRGRRDCKMSDDYTKAGSSEHTRKATYVNSENVTAHTKGKQTQII